MKGHHANESEQGNKTKETKHETTNDDAKIYYFFPSIGEFPKKKNMAESTSMHDTTCSFL